MITKEQIEAEGWSSQHIPNIVQDDELQNGYCKNINSKISYNLLYANNELLIYKQTIYNDITANWTADILFRGECKSINEFRTICKLLKV